MVAAMPGVAFAGDDDSDDSDEFLITDVLTSVTILGVGLDITIARGEGGSIESVALDPSSGATVVKERDHKVVFLLADGNTTVKIKSRDGSIRTKVSADATADVTGPGSWSADVFGTGLVTVQYDISFVDNAPTITVGGVAAPADVIAEIGDPKIDTDDGEEFSYKIKIRLTSGEERATLTLAARTEVDEDDGEVEVRVTSSLSDRDWHKDHDGDDNDRDKQEDHVDDADDQDHDDGHRDGDKGDDDQSDHSDGDSEHDDD
jgi:hypothetical protein